MELEIGIRNASEVDFDSVLVLFPDGNEVHYGKIPRGALSDFRGTTRAYRYAAIRVNVGGREFALQPIDYVGERHLSPGRYAYVLGVQDARLTCDLERVD